MAVGLLAEPSDGPQRGQDLTSDKSGGSAVQLSLQEVHVGSKLAESLAFAGLDVLERGGDPDVVI